MDAHIRLIPNEFSKPIESVSEAADSVDEVVAQISFI